MPDRKTPAENIVRIGTRGSRLARIQAEYIKTLLLKAHPESSLQIEIEVISTAGDRSQKDNLALSEIGGKGLFTMEIEEKLARGMIDMAVHSAKDMPTVLPEGLVLACFPEREEVADAFVSSRFDVFDDLAKGAVIGSASLRRRALMLRKRPDLKMIMFRGNVETRLKKIEGGVADATLLAVAGLNRLDMGHAITAKLPLDDFPPAPGQGAITIETRLDNHRIHDLLVPLNHGDTETALAAERAFLGILDGSCRTPIAAHAKIDGDMLSLHGLILKPDGSDWHEKRLESSSSDAVLLGEEMGNILRERAGPDFFSDW